MLLELVTRRCSFVEGLTHQAESGGVRRAERSEKTALYSLGGKPAAPGLWSPRRQPRPPLSITASVARAGFGVLTWLSYSSDVVKSKDRCTLAIPSLLSSRWLARTKRGWSEGALVHHSEQVITTCPSCCTCSLVPCRHGGYMSGGRERNGCGQLEQRAAMGLRARCPEPCLLMRHRLTPSFLTVTRRCPLFPASGDENWSF